MSLPRIVSLDEALVSVVKHTSSMAEASAQIAIARRDLSAADQELSSARGDVIAAIGTEWRDWHEGEIKAYVVTVAGRLWVVSVDPAKKTVFAHRAEAVER